MRKFIERILSKYPLIRKIWDGMSFVGFILIVLWLTSCEKEGMSSLKSKTTLIPVNNKTIMFPPQNFNHSKLFWVPISYYAPVKDVTQVPLRLLVPLIYDNDWGMVQPTTLNIIGADSLELDGQFLYIYNDISSQVASYPPDEGQSIIAPYTDLTVVMLVYDDSTMNIIPNARYSNNYLNVPQKPIIGFYFVTTDYFVQ